MLTPEKMKAEEERSFSSFMNKTEIKSLIALVPTNDAAPEALHSLLRASFSHAFSGGAITLALDMLMKRLEKEE